MATKGDLRWVVFTVYIVLYFLAGLSSSSTSTLVVPGSSKEASIETSVVDEQDTPNVRAGYKREGLPQADKRRKIEAISSTSDETNDDTGDGTQARRGEVGLSREGKIQTPPGKAHQETAVNGKHHADLSTYRSFPAASGELGAFGKRPSTEHQTNGAGYGAGNEPSRAQQSRGGITGEGRSPDSFNDEFHTNRIRPRRSLQRFQQSDWNTEHAPHPYLDVDKATGLAAAAAATSTWQNDGEPLFFLASPSSSNTNFLTWPHSGEDETTVVSDGETELFPRQITDCIAEVKAKHEGCMQRRKCPTELQLWQEVTTGCGHMMDLNWRTTMMNDQSQVQPQTDSDFSQSADYLGETHSLKSDHKFSPSSDYLDQTEMLALSMEEFYRVADYLGLSLPETRRLWTNMQSSFKTVTKNIDSSSHSIPHSQAWPLHVDLAANAKPFPGQTQEDAADVLGKRYEAFAETEQDPDEHKSLYSDEQQNPDSRDVPFKRMESEIFKRSTFSAGVHPFIGRDADRYEQPEVWTGFQPEPFVPENNLRGSQLQTSPRIVIPFENAPREDLASPPINSPYPGTAELNTGFWNLSPFSYHSGNSMESMEQDSLSSTDIMGKQAMENTDRTKRFVRNDLGGYKTDDIRDEVRQMTKRLRWKSLRGYKPGKRYLDDADKTQSIFGKVLGKYKIGRRGFSTDMHETPKNHITQTNMDGTDRIKRFFGKVIGGYKIGKRTDMSDEEHQNIKRLFWDFLRDYKLGKLDLNEADKTKRFSWKVLGGYKLGKREDTTAEENGVRKRLLWNFLRGYKLGKRDFAGADIAKRFWGKIIGGYKLGKRADASHKEHEPTKRFFWGLLRGYKSRSRNQNDSGGNKRVFGTVLGGYKLGKREDAAVEQHGMTKRFFPKFFRGCKLGSIRGLANADKNRRFWGKVIGGYKVGKRGDMPDGENSLSKRLFWKFLGGYKLGRRALKDADKNKRFWGKVIGGYKVGKRGDIPFEDDKRYKRLFWKFPGGYKLGRQDLADFDKTKRFWGKVIAGYKIGKRGDISKEDHPQSQGVFWEFLRGYKLGKRYLNDAAKPQRFFDEVPGNYKTGRRRYTTESHEMPNEQTARRNIEDQDRNKRFFGKVTGDYKIRKRAIIMTDKVLDVPSYQQVDQSSMDDKTERFGGQDLGGYETKKQESTVSENTLGEANTDTLKRVDGKTIESYKIGRKRSLLIVSVPNENEAVEETQEASKENQVQQFGEDDGTHKSSKPHATPIIVVGTVIGDNREHPDWEGDLQTDSVVQSLEDFKAGKGPHTSTTTTKDEYYLQNSAQRHRSEELGDNKTGNTRKRASVLHPYDTESDSLDGDRTKRSGDKVLGKYVGKRHADFDVDRFTMPLTGHFNQNNWPETAKETLSKRFWDKVFGGFKVGKRIA